MDTDNSVVIVGGGGWVEVEERMRRTEGNWKKYIKKRRKGNGIMNTFSIKDKFPYFKNFQKSLQ